VKRTQFEALVVHDFEEEVFHLPPHSHTYYEMIYIHKGNGVHVLNKNRLPYEAGDLFFICPGDEHYFDINDSTRFTFIKFTDSYFTGKLSPETVISPEKIMRNRLLKEVKLKLDTPTGVLLHSIISNIVAYENGENILPAGVMLHLILSIFGLVHAAMAQMNLRIDNGQPGKEELISYIHQQIYAPSVLKIKKIALHFNISPTYFSDYFRRTFGLAYRDYVNSYRIKLIEKRLLTPSITLKQIAGEFGFTDESHLSHYFKALKGTSPSLFRSENS
jgi:AraC-like DNA-binding protein